MFEKLILICTISFWGLLIGRTILLSLQGVRVFVIGKGKKLNEKLVEIAFVPLFILWTAEIIFISLGHPLLSLPVWWDFTAVRLCGLILCLIGLLIFIAALISFGNAWRVGIDEKAGRLVTNGIFSYSRNPIFLCMDIFFCGIFLVYPTALFLICFVCFAVGSHFQILNEERFLRSKFGAEYSDYCKRVRRYISTPHI